MSDLIDRQTAINMVREMSPELFSAYQHNAYVDKQEVMIRLMALPSATQSNESNALKALEREKGKWVIHPEVKHMYGGIYIECSECHTKYVVQHIEDEKYCRNCGADMRGETDETDQR